MITHLKIERFRGIESLVFDDLLPLNVVVGRNNSSKSSVLEAIAILMAARNGSNALRETLREVLLWRGWYGMETVGDLFYHGSENFSIVASREEETVELVFSREQEDVLRAYLSLRRNDENSISRFKTEFPVHDVFNEDIIRERLMFSWFSPVKGFEFITPIALRRFGYVEMLYSMVYRNRVMRESISLLQLAYPDVVDFSPLLRRDRWVLHVETEDGVYPYYLMGEGFKSAMIISFLAPLLRGGTLLIDSAEAFHHPKSLRVMARILVEGVKSGNLQVILTTHSLELVQLLSECSKQENVDGNLIHMKRNAGISYSTELLSEPGALLEEIRRDLTL